MEHVLNVRLPPELQKDFERERQRMIKTVGADITESALVRALLTEAMTARHKRASKRSSANERAA